MIFDECVAKINSLLKFGVKPGLDRIKLLLNKIGNPQNKLRFVHVAGTNGKGSTCTMIASVLKNAGYKTGLFLSPYVIDFRERFQINGNMISELRLANIVEDLFKVVQGLISKGIFITEFEFITAIAFLWFCEENCDVVVLEVGLGGRYDATNIIERSEVSVITSISLDHTKILGNTLESIASEKCGIIKKNGITVVNSRSQNPAALKTIKLFSENLNNKLILSTRHPIKIASKSGLKTIINYKQMQIKLPFAGDYQIDNAETSICAIECLSEKFKINSLNIKNGIEAAFIPARLEILSENPIVLLDGAHNPEAVKKLCEFVNEKLSSKNIICLFGAMSDKDVFYMLKELSGVCSKFLTVTINNKRAMPSDKIAELISTFNREAKAYDEDFNMAINDAFSNPNLKENTAVLICGSLYLASQIRPMLMDYLKNIY